MISRSNNILLHLLVVIILSGCASGYPKLTVVAPLPSKVDCRVALLPFRYEGKVGQGENIFYKAFVSELKNNAGLEVVQEGDLMKLYQQLKLYRHVLPTESQMQIIGNRLGVQLIILGEIVKMDEMDTGSYVDTDLTVSMAIYDASTGNELWTTYHRRKGEEYRNILHYGRVNTITGLARRMANEITTMWVDEGFNQCKDH